MSSNDSDEDDAVARYKEMRRQSEVYEDMSAGVGGSFQQAASRRNSGTKPKKKWGTNRNERPGDWLGSPSAARKSYTVKAVIAAPTTDSDSEDSSDDSSDDHHGNNDGNNDSNNDQGQAKPVTGQKQPLTSTSTSTTEGKKGSKAAPSKNFATISTPIKSPKPKVSLSATPNAAATPSKLDWGSSDSSTHSKQRRASDVSQVSSPSLSATKDRRAVARSSFPSLSNHSTEQPPPPPNDESHTPMTPSYLRKQGIRNKFTQPVPDVKASSGTKVGKQEKINRNQFVKAFQSFEDEPQQQPPSAFLKLKPVSQRTNNTSNSNTNKPAAAFGAHMLKKTSGPSPKKQSTGVPSAFAHLKSVPIPNTSSHSSTLQESPVLSKSTITPVPTTPDSRTKSKKRITTMPSPKRIVSPRRNAIKSFVMPPNYQQLRKKLISKRRNNSTSELSQLSSIISNLRKAPSSNSNKLNSVGVNSKQKRASEVMNILRNLKHVDVDAIERNPNKKQATDANNDDPSSTTTRASLQHHVKELSTIVTNLRKVGALAYLTVEEMEDLEIIVKNLNSIHDGLNDKSTGEAKELKVVAKKLKNIQMVQAPDTIEESIQRLKKNVQPKLVNSSDLLSNCIEQLQYLQDQMGKREEKELASLIGQLPAYTTSESPLDMPVLGGAASGHDIQNDDDDGVNELAHVLAELKLVGDTAAEAGSTANSVGSSTSGSPPRKDNSKFIADNLHRLKRIPITKFQASEIADVVRKLASSDADDKNNDNKNLQATDDDIHELRDVILNPRDAKEVMHILRGLRRVRMIPKEANDLANQIETTLGKDYQDELADAISRLKKAKLLPKEATETAAIFVNLKKMRKRAGGRRVRFKETPEYKYLCDVVADPVKMEEVADVLEGLANVDGIKQKVMVHYGDIVANLGHDPEEHSSSSWGGSLAQSRQPETIAEAIARLKKAKMNPKQSREVANIVFNLRKTSRGGGKKVRFQDTPQYRHLLDVVRDDDMADEIAEVLEALDDEEMFDDDELEECAEALTEVPAIGSIPEAVSKIKAKKLNLEQVKGVANIIADLPKLGTKKGGKRVRFRDTPEYRYLHDFIDDYDTADDISDVIEALQDENKFDDEDLEECARTLLDDKPTIQTVPMAVSKIKENQLTPAQTKNIADIIANLRAAKKNKGETIRFSETPEYKFLLYAMDDDERVANNVSDVIEALQDEEVFDDDDRQECAKELLDAPATMTIPEAVSRIKDKELNPKQTGTVADIIANLRSIGKKAGKKVRFRDTPEYKYLLRFVDDDDDIAGDIRDVIESLQDEDLFDEDDLQECAQALLGVPAIRSVAEAVTQIKAHQLDRTQTKDVANIITNLPSAQTDKQGKKVRFRNTLEYQDLLDAVDGDEDSAADIGNVIDALQDEAIFDDDDRQQCARALLEGVPIINTIPEAVSKIKENGLNRMQTKDVADIIANLQPARKKAGKRVRFCDTPEYQYLLDSVDGDESIADDISDVIDALQGEHAFDENDFQECADLLLDIPSIESITEAVKMIENARLTPTQTKDLVGIIIDLNKGRDKHVRFRDTPEYHYLYDILNDDGEKAEEVTNVLEGLRGNDKFDDGDMKDCADALLRAIPSSDDEASRSSDGKRGNRNMDASDHTPLVSVEFEKGKQRMFLNVPNGIQVDNGAQDNLGGLNDDFPDDAEAVVKKKRSKSRGRSVDRAAKGKLKTKAGRSKSKTSKKKKSKDKPPPKKTEEDACDLEDFGPDDYVVGLVDDAKPRPSLDGGSSIDTSVESPLPEEPKKQTNIKIHYAQRKPSYSDVEEEAEEEEEETDEKRIVFVQRHHWKHKKHNTTILGDRRYMKAQTYGADEVIYSPLTREQAGRRKKVNAAMLASLDRIGADDVDMNIDDMEEQATERMDLIDGNAPTNSSSSAPNMTYRKT